jgi:hypothetical protein
LENVIGADASISRTITIAGRDEHAVGGDGDEPLPGIALRKLL